MSSSSYNNNKLLTHFDQNGQAHMVDVGHKMDTHRIAIAQGTILMSENTWNHVKSGTAEKGDVLGIARVAAIMGAKKTSDIIPLCHPLPLTHISVEFNLSDNPFSITCFARTETIAKTGVEMEALTAVHIALLTIYDMLKAIDKNMIINNIHLVQKTGGKSGDWYSNQEN